MWTFSPRIWQELQFRVAAHAPTKYQSNSTFRRGDRASYRTTLPEISARRSLLEPSFRYLLPGREGEKCRPLEAQPEPGLPLDHTRQNPFVHSINNWSQFYESRGGISDFRLPTSDFQLPTSNFQLPTSDFRLPTSNFRLPTSDFRLPTSDFRLPTSNYRLFLFYFFNFLKFFVFFLFF